MSTDLYRTCVYFDAHIADPERRGLAKSEEVQIKLHAAPRIPGMPSQLIYIYYAPQVRVWEVRESAGGTREMRPPEVELLVGWLNHMVSAMRRFRQRHG